MTEITLSPKTVELLSNGHRVTITHPDLGPPGHNGTLTLVREGRESGKHAITARIEDHS